ncbi:hypothetical protein CFP71_27055 [Amycolatopsis thailandensis]|uniref:Uncharacterized protein n=1 Tax=Amycolatopsis thailandensis TaxID=589330 RepID=A0A229RVT8_9PSEU|nr:hypothetical protein CFP71_27055 [Amycolatopsis thailandensis]
MIDNESDPQLPDDDSVASEDVAGAEEELPAPPAWSRWDNEPMPTLPKMAAVRRAFDAGVTYGLPKNFAWALASAVTDPASLRAALSSPRSTPVVGGNFEFIEVDLWTPGVSPMVTNHRVFAERVYPASGAPGAMGPLRGPTSEDGETSTLVTEARDVSHVLAEAERAGNFIMSDNKLAASIKERGILMPVDVVYNEIRHDDGEPPACLLVTAEGSSRVTNAHSVLGVENVRTVMYDLPGEESNLRRFVNGVLLEDPKEPGISARTVDKRRGRRNALIVRARVILKFVPAAEATYDFAQALGGYLGMLHVDGPRPWPTTGKNEAMAESVVRALRHADAISEDEHAYLAGLMDPKTAVEKGFPGEQDAQAAYVLATILDRGLMPIVSRAIRDVTSAARAMPATKAEAAAELALRPIRSLATSLPASDPVRTQIDAMQASYRRSCRLRLYATTDWKVTGRTPQELLEAALVELTSSTGGPAGSGEHAARAELAALAQFHLTRSGSLRREPYGSGGTDADKRGPNDVLGAMVEEAQGLHLLYQAIVDGRAGRRPRVVDENGRLVRGHLDGSDGLIEETGGDEITITNGWLRYHAFPRPGVDRPMPTPPENETPAMRLARHKTTIERQLAILEQEVENLEEVIDNGGTPLVELQGWATGELIKRLGALRDRLTFWDGLASRIARRERPDTTTA